MPTKHGRDNKQNGRKAFAQYLSPTPYVKPNYPPPPPRYPRDNITFNKPYSLTQPFLSRSFVRVFPYKLC